MLNFNNKLLKLIKLAIKLIKKLIFVIGKIELTYLESQKKVENLSMSKTDLSDILIKLEKLEQKFGSKPKAGVDE